MPLDTGSRIGPYQIAAKIGEGGMGEVYRAVDSNLSRAVAIKVLPEAFARDAERLARFEREAKTLASLNHPNIAQIFGLEKGSGAQPAYALVMELVEGPTLADRIRGGPIPLEEAIPIALQIADALESAHDHGIVHRDLKPANVKVRDDGTVKVLDFGLAKATDPTSAISGSASMANSPTITSPATQAGVILGTAAYMSPEQAKGRVVDRRTDIWAFGCVLFEMLSGKRTFTGEDTSDVLISIIRDEPPWPSLPPNTPSHVRALLQRCLTKDVKKRLPHIGVARLELTDPSPQIAAAPARANRTLLAAGVAAVASLAIGATAATMWPRPAPAPALPTRLSVDLGLERGFVRINTMAFAPDGRSLAFLGASTATDAVVPAIYLRRFDRLDAQLLPGTEASAFPFFSPDGQWIGFFSGGNLKKIAVGGGSPITITPVTAPRGASWGDDDTIVFASNDGLTRVPASGGKSEVFAKLVPGQPSMEFPQMLPGSRAVVYSETTSSDPNGASVVVREFASGASKMLLRGGRMARYVASGHLVFHKGSTMFAVPFDLTTLETRGDAVPVVEDIARTIVGAIPSAAVSASGVLAYAAGTAGGAPQAPIMWLSRTGGLTPLRAASASWAFPRFSPDGRRLALTQAIGGPPDIWVYDIERDIMTRITTDGASDLSPVWTPDGTGLIYASGRQGNIANLFYQRADGTGAAVRLTESIEAQLPDSISPDGRLLVIHQGDPATSAQALTILPLDVNLAASKPAPVKELVGGRFLKANARISPDGKWIAYAASYSGRFEIYVQPFPEAGDRVQVSNGGGNLAVWSQTRNELYYIGPATSRVSVVPYTITGKTFSPAKPQVWSETRFSGTPPINTYGPGFDIHPDGQRFAVAPMPAETGASGPSQVVLFYNFFDELRRVAPVR